MFVLLISLTPSISHAFLGLGAAIEEFIYAFCVGVGGIFLWIGGSLLDYTIHYLVIGMGAFLEANLGVIIDQLWTTIRDLFNLLMIFGLIFIGFQVLLKNESSAKRTLSFFIVAALLINFSLFFTKAIIDFSNIAAFQIHNALVYQGSLFQQASIGLDPDFREGDTPTSLLLFGGPDSEVKSITGAFMQAIRLTSYADGSALDNMRKDASIISGRFIFFAIVMMFFMIFAAFTFAAGAVILIARFVALVLFMIFSPMMFLAWIFPAWGQYGEKWWKHFLSYSFVAPAYLFMLYLSLFAVGAMDTSDGSFAKAFSAESTQNGTFYIFLYFFMTTGFLLASLMVAQKMGVVGGNAAVAGTRYVRNFVGGASFGLAARGLRNTVGYGAQRVADSSDLKKATARGGIRGLAARATMAAGKKVGDSSFDLRNTENVGNNLNLGKGKKGGYKTQRDKVLKQEEELVKHLGELSDDDPRVAAISEKIEAAEAKLVQLKADPGADTRKGKKDIQDQKDKISSLYQDKRRAKASLVLGTKNGKRTYDRALEKRDQNRELQKEAGRNAKYAYRGVGTKSMDLSSVLSDDQKADYLALDQNARASRNQELLKDDKIRLGYYAKALADEAKFRQRANLHNKAAKRFRNSGKLGYAHLLETSNLRGSALMGRIPGQERHAGRHILKNTTKSVYRSKEDERFEKLAEKLEQNKNTET